MNANRQEHKKQKQNVEEMKYDANIEELSSFSEFKMNNHFLDYDPINEKIE